jgi:hypothetical protein
MQNCPIATEYIHDGKCMKNLSNCIVLPNGDNIPYAIRGRWFRDRLDHYYKMFLGKIIAPQRDRNSVTTAFFKIAPGTQVMQLEVSKIDKAEEDPDVM